MTVNYLANALAAFDAYVVNANGYVDAFRMSAIAYAECRDVSKGNLSGPALRKALVTHSKGVKIRKGVKIYTSNEGVNLHSATGRLFLLTGPQSDLAPDDVQAVVRTARLAMGSTAVDKIIDAAAAAGKSEAATALALEGMRDAAIAANEAARAAAVKAARVQSDRDETERVAAPSAPVEGEPVAPVEPVEGEGEGESVEGEGEAAPVAPVEAAPVAPVEAAPVAPVEGEGEGDDRLLSLLHDVLAMVEARAPMSEDVHVLIATLADYSRERQAV